MNKTIAILCGGPPKPKRNRHLEKFNGKECIRHVIENCIVDDVKICVILSNKNVVLKNFINNNYSFVKVIESPDYSMITTFKLALEEDENDTLIVAGDLWNLKKDNINKFLNSSYKSAIYKLKTPWGKNLISYDKKLIRRADIGDSLLLISNDHVKEYLSKENIDKAIYYFNQFYPSKKFDMNWGNYLWTWMDYSFFFDISSSKEQVNYIKDEKGTIYIEDLVYLDND